MKGENSPITLFIKVKKIESKNIAKQALIC